MYIQYEHNFYIQQEISLSRTTAYQELRVHDDGPRKQEDELVSSEPFLLNDHKNFDYSQSYYQIFIYLKSGWQKIKEKCLNSNYMTFGEAVIINFVLSQCYCKMALAV